MLKARAAGTASLLGLRKNGSRPKGAPPLSAMGNYLNADPGWRLRSVLSLAGSHAKAF
ncbi:MAG: hypothetical protein M3485_06375 [Pseudomonadota bacterium]|nr:hypothetical protein [Pseudomonadota bacterium]